MENASKTVSQHSRTISMFNSSIRSKSNLSVINEKENQFNSNMISNANSNTNSNNNTNSNLHSKSNKMKLNKTKTKKFNLNQI
jgi:hypothetical protein